MQIMMIGDIVGKNGRDVVKQLLPSLRKKYNLDFVIANGENATHGKGLIENHYHFLLDAGIDVITLGNHYLGKSEILEYINGSSYLLRPYNLKNNFPGVGTALFQFDKFSIRVTNLLGCAFMHEEVNSPYDSLKEIIEKEEKADIHIVDFHAEATGEKQSLAWAFDGQISALIGTHTHVQTHDARILTNGTALMCDVGMCGAYNSVLGCEKNSVINRIWLHEKSPFRIDELDDSIFNAVILTIDEITGKCEKIQPISLFTNHK